MADSLIEEYQDSSGTIRRLGTLIPQQGLVSSFPVFEDDVTVLDDSDIRRLITDPDRTPRRKLFGPDWVQNQNSHGSCNGFAGADALGKRRWIDRGVKELLSGAFLYSLINGGRDNGSMLEDGLRAIKETGICSASLVPWNQIYPNQQPREAREAAGKLKGLTAYAVRTRQGLRTALAAGYPCVVVVSAGRNFDRLNAQGIAGVDGGSGNHAVHCDDLCIVGGTEVFDMQNSWGPQYGQQGRAYLTWDSFAQTFRYHTFYAIGSVREEA